MPGITNSGLFASHYLRTSASARSDWKDSTEYARSIVGDRGETLIRELGYHTSWEGSSAVLLRSKNDANRAVAVLLDGTEDFAEHSARFLNSPIAYGLSVAQAKEIPWLIALRGSQLRLYSAKSTQGVGRKGQSETYLEIDLAVVDERYQALLPLIFSADALAPGGSADQLLSESSRYAVSLGERLRSRVYEEAVPTLSVAIAKALLNRGIELDHHGLDLAYGATLRVLFRLLFQAYGEDRSLLPYNKNDVYDRHALKTIANELAKNDSNGDPASNASWSDLSTAWQVIDKGDHTWGVPAYNGGLFASHDEEGQLLSEIALTDDVMIPVLRALLVDHAKDGERGPVDFRSLSVREFGTIYEGLLESSLSLAESDLTLDRNDIWIFTDDPENTLVRKGEPYFHNASGARKATGSYFTPSFLVDRLLETSLAPAVVTHLDHVRAVLETCDEPRAAELLFDFRVCDLAMGSGHFLISAIDHIEAQFSAFLAANPVPQVTSELHQLKQAAEAALGELAHDVEVQPASLLRRQIARRCIYGLDINKIAVELARVALWIHTFVRGLAMSSLDHGLVWGNSLTGIGMIDEAVDLLDPPKKGQIRGSVSLFREAIEDKLSEAATALRTLAAAAEANASDVAAAHIRYEQVKADAEGSKALFDAALAMRLGNLDGMPSSDPDELKRRAKLPAVRDLVERLNPAHMPYLFPEVFLRDKGGFDVDIGNPPWEKLKVEEQVWWGQAWTAIRRARLST